MGLISRVSSRTYRSFFLFFYFLQVHSHSKMLIYKDFITGDEICSDSYPSSEKHDGAILEVSGANIKEDGGIDESLNGGNASAEGEDAGAGADDSAVTGINVVMTHKLCETGFAKKDFKTYMKGFLKGTIDHLKKEGKDDEIPAFKKGAQAAMGVIMESFKDWVFYTGESMNPEGMIVLGNYREDGITPYFWYFKHALVEEKF